MTNEFCGIEFPNSFKDVKFVETVSGCFTLQVRDDEMSAEEIKGWEGDKRIVLVELTRKVLEKLTGQPVIQLES